MLILLVVWTKPVFCTLMLRVNWEFFRCDAFKDYLRWLKRPIPACKAQPHQSKVTRVYLEFFRRFLTLKASKPLSEHESWVHVGWGQSHYMSDLLGNHPQLLKIHQPIDIGVIAWDGKNKKFHIYTQTMRFCQFLTEIPSRSHRYFWAKSSKWRTARLVRLGYWRIFSYFLYENSVLIASFLILNLVVSLQEKLWEEVWVCSLDLTRCDTLK